MGKTIAIIPARGNSKRLPNKNIKLLNGKPLIALSILYAQLQKEIDLIYVSTNDSEIKDIALKYGAKVIDRPESLSGDKEPTITALKHVLENIEHEVNNVVLLQPTNPLRPIHLFKEAYQLFNSNDLDCLFTVSRNHSKLGRIENNSFRPYNYKIGQRSQDLEPLYFENGLLYLTKASLILEETIISENAYPLEVKHQYASVDIDTIEDFNYAKFILETYSENE